MKRPLPALLILGASLFFAPSPKIILAADDPGVRATVERYLHGLKFNDVASLRKAFQPDAKLLWVKKDGPMGQLTQEKWYEGFRESAGKEEPGDLRIVSMDVSGNAAAVKVEETYPGSRYVDYLSLLKISGEWWIVNKIYMVEKKQ